MKSLLSIFAITILATSTSSYVVAFAKNNQISINNNVGVTNGKNAKPGSAPWFCTITAAINPSIDFGLGGALISPWWVLSCAHDVYSIRALGPQSAVLRFNMYNRTYINYKTVIDRHSQKIFINPFWLKDGIHNDVSLIKLNKPIYQLPYINLPTYKLSKGDQVSVYGYGISGVNKHHQPIYDSHLKVGTLPIVDWHRGYNYPKAKFNPTLEYLAGTTTGPRVGAALDDSGGPLVDYYHKKPILDGVVSRGTEPYSYGWIKPQLTIYSSVYANLAWIKSIMQNN